MLAADLDAVMVVERSAHKHPWSAELLRRELDHDWSTVLLAIEQAPHGLEQVLGYVIFWIVHDELHILNVATAPAFRRNGVGRLLMMEAESRGRGRGAVLSTLEVRKSNEPAIQLYLSMGYRQVGLRPRYYADENEDALVMLHELSGAPL